MIPPFAGERLGTDLTGSCRDGEALRRHCQAAGKAIQSHVADLDRFGALRLAMTI
jgi:hypothetical protein